ncbi:hypothetical protein FD718_01025 [Photobacterium damselae subsp. damselae]|nr:hypothetical protein FD718_01025 [Photobacterium damselae subsp. damselae]
MENSSKKLANTSEDLTSVTQGLHESLCQIPESLNKVHGEVSKTRDALAQLSNGAQLPIRKQTDNEQRTEYVENMLLNLPPFGIVVVTALVSSNRQGFALKLDEHLSKFNGLAPEYFHGVYVTLKAAGIIDGILTDDNLYKCTYYHSFLTTDKLRELYSKVVERVFGDELINSSEYIIETKKDFDELLNPKI